MKKLILSLCFLLGVAFFLSGSPVVTAAEKPVKWRFSTFLTDKRPEWNLMELYRKTILEKSGQQLDITLYPGLSLGIKPSEALRVLRRGHIEMALIVGAASARDEPLYNVLTPQGVWKDPSDLHKWRGPLKAIKKDIFDKWGVISGADVFPIIDWIYIFTVKPVKGLEDMKGMKIRVWSADLIKTFGKLGITGQMIPRQDLYLSLKTGVIDGCLFAPAVAKALSIQEVAKYAAPIFVYTSELADIGISKKAFNKLPVASRKALMDTGPIAYQFARDHYFGHGPVEPFIKALKKDGIVFNPTFSEADLNRIRQAAFEVWKEAAEKLGPKGREYYRKLKATLN